VRAFPNTQKILIAGGQDKRLDYKPLRDALRSEWGTMHRVILFGENKKKIAQSIRRARVPMGTNTSLRRVVARAYADARRSKLPTTIIFSPGATSFDMFTDYRERGTKFKQLVQTLT
jgi:UDP-N-acetylmuramoylalanine--D-glutamate ligase